ncbi:MAG: hypothetical protein RLZZ458_3004 [Planctomycetota bacterium]
MTETHLDQADFLRHLRLNNPFDDNRVTRVESAPESVESIHRGAWDELLLQTQRAAAGVNSRSVVITGPPGIGKSHLLARYRQWVVAEKYPFVYLLNLQSGPRDILRSIVRATVQGLARDLSRLPLHNRLYKLISAGVTEAIRRYAPGEQLSVPRAGRLYLRLVDEAGLPRGAARVMWAFFEDLHRLQLGQQPTVLHRLALQWLSGDALDPEDARQLHLFAAVADDGVAASTEELKEILQLLCHFAAFQSRCLILAFDQVDTLSEDQVRAWSAAVHALLDNCHGLFVVCSGVDSTLYQWTQRGWVSKASWDDRIRQFSIALSGIQADEAQELIRRRLQRSLAGFAECAVISDCCAGDPDFPLGGEWLSAAFREADGQPCIDLRPRDVINRAAGRWEECYREAESRGIENWLKVPGGIHAGAVQGCAGELAVGELRGNSEAAVLLERLQQIEESRRTSPESLPADPGNLLGLLKGLVERCLNLPESLRGELYPTLMDCCEEVRGGAGGSGGSGATTFQFIVVHVEVATGRRRRLGVAIPEKLNARSNQHLLRRILSQLNETAEVEHAVLITDARRELTLGGRGQDHLASLCADPTRFTLQQLLFEEYLALDALMQLLRSVEAGGSQDPEMQMAVHRAGCFTAIPVLRQLLQL